MDSIARAIKKILGGRQTPSSSEANLRIVNVASIPVARIPSAPLRLDGSANDWLKLLQKPYERQGATIPQLHDEITKLYIALAERIDVEMKKSDSSLRDFYDTSQRSYDYYGNTLYTIYCVAEGEVMRHYHSRRYENAFSYRLLNDRMSPEIVEAIRLFCEQYVESLPPANKETCIALGLTPNGLEAVWWDIDGTIRSKYKLNSIQIRLLNRTPGRSTVITRIPELRALILLQYLTAISVLKKELASTPGWSMKATKYLNWVFEGKSPYWNDYSDERILAYTLKLCEQTIREHIPYAKYLSTEMEIKHLKKVLPKTAAENLLLRVSKPRKPISLENDTIRALIAQIPSAWKYDLARLHKSDGPNATLRVLRLYISDVHYPEIVKGVIKNTSNNPAACLLGCYVYYSRLNGVAPEKMVEKTLTGLITHPTQRQAFHALVEDRRSLSSTIADELVELTQAPVRTIKLDHEKVTAAIAAHESTVGKVINYLGEETPEPPAVIPKMKPVRPETSLEDVFNPGNDNTKNVTNLTPNQYDFLMILMSNGYSIDDRVGVEFVRSRRQSLGSFIQSLNQALYEAIEDQALHQIDGRIVLDAVYQPYIKETLNVDDSD